MVVTSQANQGLDNGMEIFLLGEPHKPRYNYMQKPSGECSKLG